ncbi:tautomerase family protein [Solwaraspora sp. WMMB335]|uniref:tautomerase family protein n=1 Tax=Solwaraspora sp. WMMB335 TaxID=3404118 RepID=UPI003B932F75
MPFIEVKLYEQRLAEPSAASRLITALTDAAVSVLGENARAHTWVVLTPVPSKLWGISGASEPAPEDDHDGA